MLGAKEVLVLWSYLRLQSSSDGGPHVIDGDHYITLHTHAQVEHHFGVLDPILSGEDRSPKLNSKKLILKENHILRFYFRYVPIIHCVPVCVL